LEINEFEPVHISKLSILGKSGESLESKDMMHHLLWSNKRYWQYPLSRNSITIII